MPLSPHEVRRVCVAASCSPPTVRAYLAGRPGLPLVRDRLEAALRSLGYDPAALYASEGAPETPERRTLARAHGVSAPEVLLEVPRDRGRACVVLRRMADGAWYVSVELDRDDRLAAVGWRADELSALADAIETARGRCGVA